MVCPKSQRDSYQHLSGMLERTGTDWLICMFEVYFDDSGTDSRSDIAIAACYISTKRSWDEFAKEWNDARWEEGFEDFHMASFVAPREHGHKPFCDWDNTKKSHVYERLSNIINDHKRIGVAFAVPKKAYDLVPERLRERHGKEHYTFAVRSCMGRIAEWRQASGISLPMRFVFDWEEPHSRKRKEIDQIWDELNVHDTWEKRYGIEVDGYSFERRKIFTPLQAADVLAWQMNNHIRKIMPLGHDDVSLTHPGFRKLREDQEMNLGFFTEVQVAEWVKSIEEYESIHGPLC